MTKISPFVAIGGAIMSAKCPISVLIPTKNEERNLRRCLTAIAHWADEIVVVDSQSVDSTLAIAAFHGATVTQFRYQGGWPKKRQWALENFNWRNDWILLLDADEIVHYENTIEIAEAIRDPHYDGYLVRLQMVFLGRMLRHGGTHLWKLSLIRKGKGHYEMICQDQDHSMCDMEVHEHVVVDGKTGRLRIPIRHENLNCLEQYISKHNAYSNWEAAVLTEGGLGEIEPSLFGTQAQRRRFIKRNMICLPGVPLLYFFLKYVIQLGCLDGVPGFIYAVLKGIQLFHVKAKLFEKRVGLDYSVSKQKDDLSSGQSADTVQALKRR